MLRNQKFEKNKIECIEQNLASYRAKKQNQTYVARLNRILYYYIAIIGNFLCFPIQYVLPEDDNIQDASSAITVENYKMDIGATPKSKNCSLTSEKIEDLAEVNDGTISSLIGKYTFIDWVIITLQCILWLITWKIFIMMEFGAIFFVLSCFAFIWLNLNSVKRKGPSAYSVFNPNCEQITGSYTAEKFEKELLHR